MANTENSELQKPAQVRWSALLADIRKLKTRLRRKASAEAKWIGDDISHHQGMRKGMWIAYNDAADKLERILSANAAGELQTPPNNPK